MSGPKLHHYVPQFYLRRFTDSFGHLWIWDRDRDRVFSTKPQSVAAESTFYYQPELLEQGHDPLTMEKQFAELEREVAAITSQWLNWIRQGELGDRLEVPDVNREVVSLFVALQFLRTADTRSTLVALAEYVGAALQTDDERRALHTQVLWDEELVSSFASRVHDCSWLFGKSSVATPFMTSDNPVAFRTADNRMWLKGNVLSEGTYIVYPLAPDVVMYCYPDEAAWHDTSISRFDCCISPVTFTDELVRNENTAQVFMASRFIISNRASFDLERSFAKTIGTDIYAPPGVT